MNGQRILVFEPERTEYDVDVLVPLELPDDVVTLDDVVKWLPTLHKHANHHYTVMFVSQVLDYQIKEMPKVLYAESVVK